MTTKISPHKPLVSFVIPTYHRNADLVRLLESVKRSDYPLSSIEIIIVDNANDPSLSSLVRRSWPDARIVSSPKNLYSNGARRIGAEMAHGEYIYLLDDDNTMESDCLSKLIDAMESDKKLGIVGPVMLYGDTETIWSAGGSVTKLGTVTYTYGDQPFKPETLPERVGGMDYFPNACMVRRSALLSAPLDDQNFPHNWAESDFCLRVLAAGYGIACITAAVDHHHIGYSGSLTRIGPDKTYDQAKSRILFRKRHRSKITDWAIFWLAIFPASTAVYFWHILHASQDKARTLGMYLKGTRDGVTTRLRTVPEITNQSIHTGETANGLR